MKKIHEMRHKHIMIIAAVSACLLSCTKDFEKINTDPTSMNFGSIKASNMFEPLFFQTGAKNQYYSWIWSNELVQVTAFTGGSTRQEHLYLVTDGNAQSVWDDYARRAADAQHMIGLAIDQGDDFYHAIGLIMKCWQMAELASIFGDMPYTEAFRYSEHRYPVFESQEQVFGNIIRDLDSANVILARKPTSGYSGLDQMYGANTEKWRRFANSLKLRYLCRLSGISDKYWDEIANILANPEKWPVFRSNADNAAVPFKGVDPYKSYWGEVETTKGVFQQHRLTQQLIKMTSELDSQGNAIYIDPRLSIWGVQTGGKWKGTVSGGNQSNRASDDNGTSKPNFEILGAPDLPAFLMEYSEIVFIKAEGLLKGKLDIPGATVKDLYEEALRANMEKWTPYAAKLSKPVSMAKSEIDKYLASSLGSFDLAGTEDSIYAGREDFLLSQKWLSLFWVGWETWHEWRRTEYPLLTIGEGTVYNEHELPTRFVYPSYTMSSNNDNANAALSRMGGKNDMHLALDWSWKKLSGGNHRRPYGSD